MIKYIYIIAAAFWQFAELCAFSATSVSQFGVTWSFSHDRPVGQFANGDWWVVGPVTITGITPGTTNDRSGTMVNPSIGIENGWDSRIKSGIYSSSLNIAKSLPATVAPGTSVMSSVSFVDNATLDNPQLESITILTVLGSAAPAGSFRPPYQGSDKSLKWNVSQMNFGVLRRLAPTASTPLLSKVESYFARPWIEKEDGWRGRYFHPRLNHPFQDRGLVGSYGREMAHTAADGLLSLQINYSDEQKRTLLIRMVQVGIDIYGAARLGARWGDGGGHNQGRKMPLLLAGMVLGDSDMLRYADTAQKKIFQEDLQTFYVTSSDVALTHIGVNNSAVEQYSLSDIGMPEWGFNHQDQPQYDNKLWGCLYRKVTGPCTMGHVLTAILMGAKSKWNNPACFDYYDRFYGIESGNVSTGTNSIQPFVSEMWKAYRGVAPPVVTISTPAFTPDGGTYADVQNVTITCATPGTSIRYTTNGSAPTATSGTVYGGPVALGVGTTSLYAIAYDATGVQSAVRSANYAISGVNQVATPTASPPGGAFLVSQSVSLATPTLGATIRYTVNGAVPDGTSPVYVGPFTVASNTTVQAIAGKSGMTNSPIMNAVFTIGSVTVGNQWSNLPISPQTGAFSFSIDAVPSAAGIDAVVGLSTSSASNFSDLAAIVRFSPNGVIDARDGGTYAAVNVLTYMPGTKYHVAFVVDVPKHRYSATVTVPGGTPVIIANNYAFRTEQAAVTSITNLAMFATSGSCTFSAPLVGSRPPPPRNVRVGQ